eukprot:GEMP01030223.1.p1 GENE.GEMP01030223.1~~GEMP01030223.1.p1  ORF type:complete len:419 (+),score=75.91 GEMP01030223.1:24-1259(+)
MLLAQPRIEQLVAAGCAQSSNHSSLYRAAAVETTLKILSDVLRRPPPSLEVSPNEKEDYVRDNRWPFDDCTKGQLLGRGGFAVVWLARDNQNRKCAVKQIVRRNQSDVDAANSEILCAKLLRDNRAEDVATHRGQRHIVALLSATETRQCLWLMQEYGGIPLSKMMFETSGISHNGTRIYDVKHLPFLQLMRKDDCIIKLLLVQILLALDLLQLRNIVHADLKPDNILIGGGDGDRCPLRVRLCDFGSAFIFDDNKVHRAFATPEYMPPEALRATSFSSRSFPSRRSNFERPAPVTPWSFDIWSTGCLWLEILHGVPLWIPFECLLPSGQVVKRGLFGVQRRDPARIVTSQEAVVKDLPALWRKWNCDNADDVSPEYCGLTLLKQMLLLRPSQRICTSDALTHPFLQHLPL